MSIEYWREIPQFEGHYEASSLGRIRSIKRGGNPLVLKPLNHTGGYHSYALWLNGKQTRQFAHALILTAFCGPRPPKYYGAHLNGIKTDNRVANLVWASPSENQAHREGHTTRREGVKRGKFNPLNRHEAERIRERYGTVGNITAVAKEMGYPRTTVADVVNMRTWK